jgi:hypothetical protein
VTQYRHTVRETAAGCSLVKGAYLDDVTSRLYTCCTSRSRAVKPSTAQGQKLCIAADSSTHSPVHVACVRGTVAVKATTAGLAHPACDTYPLPARSRTTARCGLRDPVMKILSVQLHERRRSRWTRSSWRCQRPAARSDRPARRRRTRRSAQQRHSVTAQSARMDTNQQRLVEVSSKVQRRILHPHASPVRKRDETARHCPAAALTSRTSDCTAITWGTARIPTQQRSR